MKIRRKIHRPQIVEKIGSSGWIRTSNPPVNRRKKTALAALCGRVLDVAGSRVITRRIRRFSTFALCRRLLPFAALCCTERARKGQRPGGRPPHRWRRSSFGEGQVAEFPPNFSPEGVFADHTARAQRYDEQRRAIQSTAPYSSERHDINSDVRMEFLIGTTLPRRREHSCFRKPSSRFGAANDLGWVVLWEAEIKEVSDEFRLLVL